MIKNSLGSRITMALRRLSGKAYLTEKDIDEVMKEIRLSLLEADVNLSVVKDFTASIKEKASGEKILKGLNPDQQVIKIVKDEIIKAFGTATVPLNFKEGGLSVFMLIGLQGSGKTTTIAKLAKHLGKTPNRKILMIAADVYRPAAIEQLAQLGRKIKVEVFQEGQGDPLKIVKNGLNYATKNDFNIVLIDTAGRLAIDEKLIEELIKLKQIAQPQDVLLTVDAAMGQDAANTAKSFHEQVGATGVILTKLDGDTRGGAALSVNQVSHLPIKFQGTGEQLDDLEVFHPDRMASRILDMGDVLTLIENVEENIDENEMLNMTEKLKTGKFNYEDLLKQFKMIKRLGSFSKILGFLPGMGNLSGQIGNLDQGGFAQMQAIIQAMTKEERHHPELVEYEYSRKKRIARGAGVEMNKVTKLGDTLRMQLKTMRQMAGLNEEDLAGFADKQLSTLQKHVEQGQTKLDETQLKKPKFRK